MRASPLKVLPIPIPAWAALPRELEEDDADGSCTAPVTVVISEIAGVPVCDDDGGGGGGGDENEETKKEDDGEEGEDEKDDET